MMLLQWGEPRRFCEQEKIVGGAKPAVGIVILYNFETHKKNIKIKAEEVDEV